MEKKLIRKAPPKQPATDTGEPSALEFLDLRTLSEEALKFVAGGGVNWNGSACKCIFRRA